MSILYDCMVDKYLDKKSPLYKILVNVWRTYVVNSRFVNLSDLDLIMGSINYIRCGDSMDINTVAVKNGITYQLCCKDNNINVKFYFDKIKINKSVIDVYDTSKLNLYFLKNKYKLNNNNMGNLLKLNIIKIDIGSGEIDSAYSEVLFI